MADTFHLAAMQVYAGKADGVLGENMVFAYYSQQGERARTSTKMIALFNQPKRDISFAVRKDDVALLNKINDGLDKIRANGTYDQITRKWMLNTAKK